MQSVEALLLEAVLEISHDNILVADQNGRVLRASPNCLRIYGVAPEEMVGRSVHELETRKVFRPSVTALVLRTGQQRTVLQTTLTGRRVIATGLPVRGEGGELRFVVSASYDLSDIEVLRREYEHLSEQMMRRLAGQVETRPEGDTVMLDGLLFHSETMRELSNLILRIAKSDVTVLLLGPSGVGKTALARLLHRSSRRSAGPFVEVNCGAIPDTLFESEVFGHEPGAFTGARREGKPGLIERADGGTLFLDEVADLPPESQRKLLKVLQDRQVTRIGAIRERSVDLRLVVSTNHDLPRMVERGDFRLDLYYRINSFPVHVPPLRERRTDIAALLRQCLDRLERVHGSRKRLSLEAEQQLMRYDWPGNVRELESVVERLFLSTDAAVIDDLSVAFAHLPRAEERAHTGFSPAIGGLKAALADRERELVEQACADCRTTYEIARYLGISQASAVRRLKRFGLSPARAGNRRQGQTRGNRGAPRPAHEVPPYGRTR